MSKKKQNHYAIFSISILIIGLTTLAFISNGFLDIKNGLNPGYLGNYGDFIGGFLGTVLTIIATVYIYKTYHSQKKELKSQKKELQLQKQLIAQQQFESTFFNMLNVHLEIKKNIVFTKSSIFPIDVFSGEIKGRSFFEFAKNDLKILLEYDKSQNDPKLNNAMIKVDTEIMNKIEKEEVSINQNSNIETNDESSNHIKKRYDHFHKYYSDPLAYYFRNLYHLLKFINNSITEKEKAKVYSDFVQSQMSNSELLLLFYNCFKFDNARKEIKKLDFLENVTDLFSNKHSNIIDIGNLKYYTNL